jgi:heme exporter protein D
MHWAGLSEFWAMGGYGLYVWGSYFVTVALFIIEIVLVRKGRVQTLNLLKRMRKMDEQ